MFSSVMRLVGVISAKETTTHIIIEGLDGNAIMADLDNTWGTTRISKYMFSLTTRSKVMFPKFFAIDILYMFQTMLKQKRTRYPKRSYQKLIDELMLNTWLGDVGKEERVNLLNFW